MIIARDIMSSQVTVLEPEMDFIAATKILVQNHYNGAPVVNSDGKLVGILCQSDLVAQHKRLPLPTLITLLDSFVQLTSSRMLEQQARKIAALTVAEAMTTDPVTVNPDTTIDIIAELMVDRNLHTLPVVEDGRLIGIVGKEDVLRTLLTDSKSN